MFPIAGTLPPPKKRRTRRRKAQLYHPGICFRGKVSKVLFLPAPPVVFWTFPTETQKCWFQILEQKNQLPPLRIRVVFTFFCIVLYYLVLYLFRCDLQTNSHRLAFFIFMLHSRYCESLGLSTLKVLRHYITGSHSASTLSNFLICL